MRETGRLARFEQYDAEPERSIGLAADHPAITDGHTLFRARVTPTAQSVRFLVSGQNNAKIGKLVIKGPWSGFPIFTLTLEERATCPRSCDVWSQCYGNAMQWPPRWDAADPLFLDTLRAEVITTCRLHPHGLVVRLHVLGDFYSVDYVKMWTEMVDRFPQLHIYGYTARREDADDAESRNIAKALRWLTETAPDQFNIRFSRTEPGPGHAIVVDEDPKLPDVIVCPAQLKDTETCGTCALCWAEPARKKTIAFLRHGLKRKRKLEPQQRALVLVEQIQPGPRSTRAALTRELKGGLPGETNDQRVSRVREYVAAHPEMSYSEIQRKLRVPINVVKQAGASLEEKRARAPRAQFMPPAKFVPKPDDMAQTAEERLKAVSDAERARIAATYGATFKPG